MILVIFCLISAAAGIIAAAAGLNAWQSALVFLGAFAGINLLYVLFWYAVSMTVSRDKPLEKMHPIYPFGCASIAGWLCAWGGVRTTVRGEEKLPSEGRFLMVCNHRSMYDPIVTEYKLRKYRLAFISKPSNLQITGISKLAIGAGFLAINRENDREALKSILQAADYLKRDLCSMVVYPEGTRSKTGELGPFHAGSFKIAQRANVPVVVAAIRGTEKVSKNFPFRPTHVDLDILETIPAEKVKAMSTQELSAYCRALIERQLESQEAAA